MSPKQSVIIHYLRDHQDINLGKSIELIGGNIYCNERFHVGNILSNMVKRGMIVRVKRGVFALPAAGAVNGLFSANQSKL